MTRPRLSVRLAGSPLGASLLFVLYAAIVVGWHQGGRIPWWMAVGAVSAAGRTWSAIRMVRRYKAWLADWQAMGAENEPPRPPKKRGRGWTLPTSAALLLLVIPVCVSHARDHEALVRKLTLLWFSVCLYLVLALLWTCMRRVRAWRRRKVEKATAGADAPVSWLIEPPPSSSSRMEAAVNLPEYSGRLLDWHT